MNSDIVAVARAAKAATKVFDLDSAQKNAVLVAVAEAIKANAAAIQAANAEDLARAKHMPTAFLDRLRFDAPRIFAAADGLVGLTALEDPVGKTLDSRTLYNGLRLKKVTAPLGVIAIIYEARPNVTVDSFGLCLKSGNAVVLRGSGDAAATDRVTVGIIRSTLEKSGVNPDVVCAIECDHDGVNELLSLTEYIDLAIPRGSKRLIQSVRGSARVPVIETGAGNCCLYVDGTYDIELAKKIIINAKTSRMSVCNALESLLIDKSALWYALPIFVALHDAGVTLHGDGAVCNVFGAATPATDDDWEKEYLAPDISVKTVDGVEDAVEYINKYGSHHSDAILSDSETATAYFFKNVDSAVVYSNASTRFTDGGQFGYGAEMGISTQKLHARGPMGVNELVTYKYLVCGDGQVRE